MDLMQRSSSRVARPCRWFRVGGIAAQHLHHPSDPDEDLLDDPQMIACRHYRTEEDDHGKDLEGKEEILVGLTKHLRSVCELHTTHFRSGQ